MKKAKVLIAPHPASNDSIAFPDHRGPGKSGNSSTRNQWAYSDLRLVKPLRQTFGSCATSRLHSANCKAFHAELSAKLITVISAGMPYLKAVRDRTLRSPTHTQNAIAAKACLDLVQTFHFSEYNDAQGVIIPGVYYAIATPGVGHRKVTRSR
jgi:hypothetical protein